MVSERMMTNALEMSLEEVENPNNIRKGEMKAFKKRFDGLFNQLLEDAEEEEEEDE